MPTYTVVDDPDNPQPMQHPGITLVDPDGGPFNPATFIPSGTYAAPDALSFDLCRNVTLEELVGSNPRIMDTLGEYIYGAMSGALYRATDELGPWTLVKSFGGQTPSGGIKETGDGEVIVARATEGLWKSSGWTINPLTATWSQVLNTNGSQVVEFTWDTDPGSGRVVATTYDAGDMTNSRYVWFSSNNGNTFSVVFDKTVAHPSLAVATSHMHLAKFDNRWSASVPRIWVSYHKTTADPTEATDPLKRLIYSDNDGATWTTLSTEDQPVTGISVERGMIFTSDTNPTALNIVERTTNPASMTVGLLYRIRANNESLWGWGIKAIYGSEGMVHIGFRSSIANMPGGVVTTDGYRSVQTLTIPAATSADQVLVGDIALHNNRLLGTYYQNVSVGTVNALQFRADEPRRGVPPEGDNGITGGTAGNLSAAIGLNASAPSFKAVAIGPNSSALAEGTAVGEATSAPLKGVAVGRGAIASATNGSAIGFSAAAESGTAVGWTSVSTGDGTAIGNTAKANLGEGTAVGYFAEAGLQSVAVGRIAKALSDNAVALGRGATATAAGAIAIGRQAASAFSSSVALGESAATTAATQVAVGGRHMEANVASSPTAPASNKVRLWARLDANSKVEWVARFPTGATMVISTEVGVSKVPALTTVNRPTAAAAGAGGMVFDTTLGKPVWSTGSAWVDATGTVS